MDALGYVYYTPDSYAADIWEDIEVNGGAYQEYITIHAQKPFPGVGILLIDQNTNYFACATTDINGKYMFTNVGEGMYKLVEVFGYETEYSGSTIDFESNKKLLSEPVVSKDPTIGHALAMGLEVYDANRIVSLSPNEIEIMATKGIIAVKVDKQWNKVDEVNFKDSPQRCEQLIISEFTKYQDAIMEGENLIEFVDKGTFGSCASGTAPSIRYQSLYAEENFTKFPQMEYSAGSPNDGNFCITNIAASASFDTAWFDTADHTSGDETGRFMIVNGDYSGTPFFEEIIKIEPDTVYLFSCWAMNIMRFSESTSPQFSINIRDADTKDLLYSDFFSKGITMPATYVPTWRQIGAIIEPDQVENRTNLAIEFISEGNYANGNDYAVDDILIVGLKRGVYVEKSIVPNKDSVELGGELTYVCTITNSNEDENISDVIFKDQLQDGVDIKDNELLISCSDIQEEIIKISGISELEEGINIGVILSNLVQQSDPNYEIIKLEKIPPKVTVTIKFTIVVKSINELLDDANVKNKFNVHFLPELDEQNPERARVITSNEVKTKVIYSKLEISKKIYKMQDKIEIELPNGSSIDCGDNIIYKILLSNKGNADTTDAYVTDLLDEILYPEKALSSSPESWIGSISKQIISPSIGEEIFLSSSDIETIDSNRNSLKIKNIDIPTRGECAIRIYTKVKC